MWSLLADWSKFRTLAVALLAFEAVLSVVIIKRIPYTEIDWIAYMQEVGGYLGGELDYTKLRGDTGPLVYPAGFVYIYSGLYWLTNTEAGPGTNILLAQYVFAALYVATQAVVFGILHATKPCKPYVAILLCLSRRLHSIFMLRLFNDGVAMLFAYAALWAFASKLRRKWLIGCILFSLGVSVKMNVLLFAPALLLLLLRNVGVFSTIGHLAVCAAVQVLLGLPFLLSYPWSYVSKAFEFSRVFQYMWTVNWKFLDPEVFVSKQVAVALLAGHLGTLCLFLWRWAKIPRKLSGDAPAFILLTLMTSNFIGVAFARTLHYQFFSWYFHCLPILAFSVTDLPTVGIAAILLGVEVAFNMFPATSWSSAILQLAHGVLLLGLLTYNWRARFAESPQKPKSR